VAVGRVPHLLLDSTLDGRLLNNMRKASPSLFDIIELGDILEVDEEFVVSQ
jgi:hypothetical protein